MTFEFAATAPQSLGDIEPAAGGRSWWRRRRRRSRRRNNLDNLSDQVATDAAYPSYLPIMSFVGGKSYIHGFENKRSDTAAMPKDLAGVMPGEGV